MRHVLLGACMLVGACGVSQRQEAPSCTPECAPDGLHPGPCVQEFDRGLDGIVDMREVTEYDGCETSRREIDHDGDGDVDSVVTWERDGSGLVVMQSSDRRGVLLSVTFYQFDGAGFLVLEEHDLDADGSIDLSTEYVNDEMGNVVDEKWYVGDELKLWTVRRFDGEGRLLVIEDHHYSCPEWSVFTGEIVAARTTFDYDADGNIVLMEVDEEDCDVADGSIDERTVWTYDPVLNIVTQNTDLEDPDSGTLDGIPDRCIVEYLDERGLVSRREADGYRSSTDGCDGSPEGVWLFVYDDEGRMLEYQVEDVVEGRIRERYAFTYDSCGNLTEQLYGQESSHHGWLYSRSILDYGCWD